MNRNTATLTWIAADGTELDLTGDIVVRDGPVGLDAPPPVLTTEAGYDDGQVLTNARHDARVVALPLAILSADAQSLQGVKADLARRMNVRKAPGELRCVVDGRTRVLRRVAYQGGLDGDETMTRDTWSLMVLSFLALDPFWYGDEQAIVLSSPNVPAAWDAAIPWSSPYPWNGPGVGVSAGLGWNSPNPWSSQLPWNGGAIVAPNVLGDVGVWPRFDVMGPATAFEVIHLRTGERVASVVPLAAGQLLTVDTQPGAARGVTMNGAPAWDLVSLDSTADMVLEPDDTLAVVMSGTGVDSTFRVTWTDRWLTPYGGELLVTNAVLTEDGVGMLTEAGLPLEGEG